MNASVKPECQLITSNTSSGRSHPRQHRLRPAALRDGQEHPQVRVEVNGRAWVARAGAFAFLPRQLPHAFVVTSPQTRFLTLHTPAGFDQFTLAAGTSVDATSTPPPDELPPDPSTLATMAAAYGIEILGPPPAP